MATTTTRKTEGKADTTGAGATPAELAENERGTTGAARAQEARAEAGKASPASSVICSDGNGEARAEAGQASPADGGVAAHNARNREITRILRESRSEASARALREANRALRNQARRMTAGQPAQLAAQEGAADTPGIQRRGGRAHARPAAWRA